MLRAGACKNVELNGRFGKLRVVHFLQLVAGDGFLAVANAQHLPDAHGGLRVIAGDHLHADPGLLAGANRVDGFRAGRIHHAGNPQEHQAFLQIAVFKAGHFAVGGFVRRCNHTQAFAGVARHLLFPVLTNKGFGTFLAQLLFAQGEDHIRCAGH